VEHRNRALAGTGGGTLDEDVIVRPRGSLRFRDLSKLLAAVTTQLSRVARFVTEC